MSCYLKRNVGLALSQVRWRVQARPGTRLGAAVPNSLFVAAQLLPGPLLPACHVHSCRSQGFPSFDGSTSTKQG